MRLSDAAEVLMGWNSIRPWKLHLIITWPSMLANFIRDEKPQAHLSGQITCWAGIRLPRSSIPTHSYRVYCVGPPTNLFPASMAFDRGILPPLAVTPIFLQKWKYIKRPLTWISMLLFSTVKYPFTSNETSEVAISCDSRLLGHIYCHSFHLWGGVDDFDHPGDCCGGRVRIWSGLDYNFQQFYDPMVWKALSVDLPGFSNSNLSSGRTSCDRQYGPPVPMLIFRSGDWKPNDSNVSSCL